MIITSGNVSMSSTRSYQRNIQGKTTTTRWQMVNPANMHSTTLNYSSNYKEEDAYNNYNDFARNLKNANANIQQDYKKDSSQLLDNHLDLSNGLSTKLDLGLPTGLSAMRSNNDPIRTLEESAAKTLRMILDMLYRAKGLTRDRMGDYNYYDSSSPTGLSKTSFPQNISGTSNIALNVTSAFSSATSGIGTLWNQVTESYYSFEESETTTFASTGTAYTADGRCIEFDVSFTMSRAFKEEYQTCAFSQFEQVLTDPLVIHLDSNPDTLAPQTFFFDIDCDGKKDEISSLNSSAGFLALDRNNDGIINDGSELFGTKSGNGFRDLMQYDEDGNGWIDEADSIYKLLKVWTKDEQGNDRLLSLKDADVGAIYLGNTKTQFSLTDSDNNLNGLMRSTGIYLKENGGSGHISQIDLAKH